MLSNLLSAQLHRQAVGQSREKAEAQNPTRYNVGHEEYDVKPLYGVGLAVNHDAQVEGEDDDGKGEDKQHHDVHVVLSACHGRRKFKRNGLRIY